LFESLESVPPWLARVEGLGDGDRSELDAKTAIEIARESTPEEIEGPFVALPEGLAVGDPVIVLPEEPGSGTVAGELLASGVHEIAVRRRADRAGELVVHFPREDYVLVKAG